MKSKPLTKEEEFQEACIRGLFIFMVLFCTVSYADSMILVGYEEVEDCKEQSIKVCHKDEHDIDKCKVVSPCDERKDK